MILLSLILRKTALSFLQSENNDPSSLQTRALTMLLAGHDVNEPQLRSLLATLKKQHIQQIKEKARILVPDARNLLGICDQTNKLKAGQVFIRIGDQTSGVIIRGKVAVCKNPAVHPGGFFSLKK